jgi:hypothetical protein
MQIEDMLLSLDVDNQSYYTHLIYDSVHSRCCLHSVCAWLHVDEQISVVIHVMRILLLSMDSSCRGLLVDELDGDKLYT